MEIFYILYISLAIVLLLIILFLVLNNKNSTKDNKFIEESSEKTRLIFTSYLKEISKDLNDFNKNFIIESSKYREENSKLLNEQIDKIRINIENKLAFEFDRFDKTFKLNNESLNKINISLRETEKKMTDTISENMEKINLKVESRLSEGFQQTNKAFISVIERLSKIDEAQKKIENLSTDIVSLQDILSDKKARGSYGEVQLSLILNSNFGENNTKLFELQKKLSNDTIVDAFLHLPEKYGNIAIDSKFPLENYQKTKMSDISVEEKNKYIKMFIQDVKKHIDDISNKYIIKGETADQALMFVPSEAVFAEINAYFDDLITYANRKGVAITSPTTLMALLKVILLVYKDSERSSNAKELFAEIERLGQDFTLYSQRWQSLQKDIEKVSKDVKDINVTTNKLTNKFEKIYNGKIDFIEEDKSDIKIN